MKLNNVLISFILIMNFSKEFTFAAVKETTTSSTNNSLQKKKPAHESSPYQIHAGYWNDNFITRKVFGEIITNGKDDNVTASFWIQFSKQTQDFRWIYDVYHNIITNKSQNYRTDLLTLRLSLLKVTGIGSFQFGSGIIANNNFGGRALQNGYHSLFNLDRVELPYTKQTMNGMISFFRYSPTFWDKNHMKLNGYVSNSSQSRVIPSNNKAGLEGEVIIHSQHETHFFRIQTQAGYIIYYLKGRYMSHIFDNGFTYSMLVSKSITDTLYLSSWFTKNQYGIHQPHFGLALSYGLSGKRMIDIHDITYP